MEIGLTKFGKYLPYIHVSTLFPFSAKYKAIFFLSRPFYVNKFTKAIIHNRAYLLPAT